MTEPTPFEVVFMNNGDIVIQTAAKVYVYTDPRMAANDAGLLLAGNLDHTWESNLDERTDYDFETVRNGGYQWHTVEKVQSILAEGTLNDHGWRNVSAFYAGLGVSVYD